MEHLKWYAIQLDQAARLEVEDRQKLEGKKKEAALTYAILKQQELELDNVAKLHKEEQREEGRKQKAVQKVWRDKEKARKAELEVWRRQEKLRAESAKEELMDNYRATVAKEAEKENEEENGKGNGGKKENEQENENETEKGNDNEKENDHAWGRPRAQVPIFFCDLFDTLASETSVMQTMTVLSVDQFVD